MLFIKFLKQFYYEFLSYFVADKVFYKIDGKCKMCGKCCRYMYSYDTYTEKEFRFMQFLYPAYRRFKIVGTDEEGNLIFGCKLISDDNKCTVYNKRLRMCRNYPVKKLSFYGKLHEGCGYNIKPEKTFEEMLSVKET